MVPDENNSPPPPRKELPSTFRELLREKNPTERTLMQAMRLAYRSIKQREDDPGHLTFEEAFRVAKLIGKPIEDVAEVVIKELKRNMREAARKEAATKRGTPPNTDPPEEETQNTEN